MIRDVINSLIEYASIHLGLEGLDEVYAKNLVLGELELDYPSEKSYFTHHSFKRLCRAK